MASSAAAHAASARPRRRRSAQPASRTRAAALTAASYADHVQLRCETLQRRAGSRIRATRGGGDDVSFTMKRAAVTAPREAVRQREARKTGSGSGREEMVRGRGPPKDGPLSRRARTKMGDARAAASSSEDAAATVAPLLALWNRAQDATFLQRWARALELSERALEQARRTLPPNNLVVAWMIGEVVPQNLIRGHEVAALSSELSALRMAEIAVNAWENSSHLQAMSFEGLATCCSRFEAGTLCTPTPEERAFFVALSDLLDGKACPLLERLGDEILLSATHGVLDAWASVASEERAVITGGISATLQTALSLDGRGELKPWMEKREIAHNYLPRVMACVLDDVTAGQARGSQFFVAPPETKAALRRLQARLPALTEARTIRMPQLDDSTMSAWQKHAAADLARHGLAADLRAAGLRRQGAAPALLQVLQPLPERLLLLARASARGLEAPSPRGPVHQAYGELSAACVKPASAAHATEADTVAC